MNKYTLLFLKKEVNFITLLINKTTYAIFLTNYLIYIELAINFKEFKAVIPI